MSRAAFAWIAEAGKAERKAERAALAAARKARTKAPDPSTLRHRVTIPRYRWPAAFAALDAKGAPFLADCSDDGRTVHVATTAAGRATLERFEVTP